MNKEISSGNNEDGKEDGECEPAKDGSGERSVCLASLPQFEGHRKETEDGGERSHQDGAEADFAGSGDSLADPDAGESELAGEFDDQDAVRDSDADKHDDAHERHDIERGVGEPERQQDAREAWGNGEEDDKGIQEAGELGDQDEIEQNGSEHEAETKARKALAHGLNGTAEVNAEIAREFFISNDLFDCGSDAA